MKLNLPDVNILVALHDVKHVGHNQAHNWFENEGKDCWVTCPLTENGFIRVFSQSQYPNNVQGVMSAISLLENMMNWYGSTHYFWQDGVSLRDRNLVDPAKIAGPKQITDVYLLALCQQNGGTLVTLDAKMTVSAIVSPRTGLLRIL